MCRSPLHPLLQALPKCEHHMHVEGSLSPELLFTLAKRNNVTLPEDPAFASVEALYARYDQFSCLDDFLHYYYIGMSVLVTAADFETLALAYFERAHSTRVRHAEIFFDPQAHLERGVALSEVVAGLDAASRVAESRWGLTSLLIPCLLRHLPVEDSGRVAESLRPYWPSTAAPADSTPLAGLGLCSSERDRPPTLWSDIYADTRKAGLATRFTAHAGEEGPAEYVSLALDHLAVERIDHGNAAAQDPELMARLARDRVMLTVCPLSNVRLRVAPSVAHVPIRTFLDAGVAFSVNSDDPAYFGGYIQENYCAVQDAHILEPKHWEIIVRNAVTGSWCDDDRKAVLLAEIDSVFGHWHNGTLAVEA
ncbi:adenosine deaminase [Grosmannia clavigera kw1407]|uniref:Adenine deaminase n=1 Tax=Grosmannia clavigera (strain kw1407 / UAMH 11150) TaxID=655863 RepID=F0X712_GROCL|nr:adenosine deaminase [Grosmannia clavigera kw1407]EFX06640.1 adenosine deaminase [Grosmannia clavigera kw1407]